MTTPAVIKQADLRKLVTMAKEHRVQIEWERDGVKIKVTPDAEVVAPAPRKRVSL